MSTLKFLLPFHWVKVLPALVLLFAAGCNDAILEEEQQPVKDRDKLQLKELLSQVNLESGIIIVQREGSVQDALDAAKSGNAIYIEPGTYKEALQVDKPDIRLVGLNVDKEEVIIENPGTARKGINLKDGRHQVEVENIQFQDFPEENAGVAQLKRSKRDRIKSFLGMSREDLGNGIAHYQFELRLGEDDYDVVRLHRVVKERRPYRPVHTKGDVFMIHGAAQDFEDIFLTAGAEQINEHTSAPYYMASRNIDVWGIDMGWTMVPLGTTDFSFMKGWGIDKDVDHTLKAMVLSRLIRGITGQSFSRMNLLGYSYSVNVAYGAAGRETQCHPIMRHIKGIIPVDGEIKYELPKYEELRQAACGVAADAKANLESGMYHDPMGLGFINLSKLALNAPNDPSPIPDFEGLTNKQAIMAVASSPRDTISYWHFIGGNLQEFYYTDVDRFIRLGAGISPYMPQQIRYETATARCDQDDVSYDDHIGDISVPVFYLGARGGTGEIGYYSGSLTSSSDVTHYNVTVPGKEMVNDYGHADLWMANNAGELVWSKLYGWLVKHSGRKRW